MNKKIIGIIIIIILIAIVVLGFYLFRKPDSSEIENKFESIIKNEITKQKNFGVNLYIKEVKAYSDHQGHISLDCEEKISFDQQEAIANSIGQEIIDLYAEKYDESEQFFVDLYICEEKLGGWRVDENGVFILEY